MDNQYTPVEQKEDKKQENDQMETTHKHFKMNEWMNEWMNEGRNVRMNEWTYLFLLSYN